MEVGRALLKPRNALMVGGVVYGMGVFYMATRYPQKSNMRKIFTDADKEFQGVHPLHLPGEAPLVMSTKK
jgi:hypothetical protein